MSETDWVPDGPRMNLFNCLAAGIALLVFGFVVEPAWRIGGLRGLLAGIIIGLLLAFLAGVLFTAVIWIVLNVSSKLFDTEMPKAVPTVQRPDSSEPPEVVDLTCPTGGGSEGEVSSQIRVDPHAAEDGADPAGSECEGDEGPRSSNRIPS